MYNLMMRAVEGHWNTPPVKFDLDRFLAYTHAAVAAKFLSLSDEAISALKSLPALFCYERGVQDVARVGRITSIQRGAQALTVTWDFDPSVPPIQPQVIESLYGVLDISNPESYRNHWAVKEVDLHQVLTQRGIMVPQAPPPPPTVFISYSWDSAAHEQWVAELAGYLRGQGIDARLDRWDVRAGQDLTVFMEQALSKADRVLLICTERYAQKASKRIGGVGYEQLIVSGEMMRNLATDKFIPIVRQAQRPPQLPPYLASRFHFDLSEGPRYAEQLAALVRELHGVRAALPPLGPNPFR
jgi:TIR domain